MKKVPKRIFYGGDGAPGVRDMFSDKGGWVPKVSEMVSDRGGFVSGVHELFFGGSY